MGACSFSEVAEARTALEAFSKARDQAGYEHGHGYSGSLSEKGRFIVIEPEAAKVAKLKRARRAELRKRMEALKGAPVVDQRTERGLRHRELAGEKGLLPALFVASEEVRAKALRQVEAEVEDAEAWARRQCVDWDDPRVEDKWGPAGCVVLREPDVVRRRSKAGATKEAQRRWGATAEVVMRRREHRSYAEVMVVTKETGLGVNTPVPGGYRRCVAYGEGADAAEARGAVFARPGKYVFFGWAPS